MLSRLGQLTRLLCLLWLAWGLLPNPAQAEALPETVYISGVAGHPQTYSLSCEARSAADWAAFWGVTFTEAEFLAALPRSDNPDTGFVGKPTDPWGYTPPKSYGVYAAPVAATLRSYGLQAEARRGLAWDDLRAEVAAGRPVIVWVIGQMWKGYPYSYTPSDGQTVTVAAFEHTMILVGYDAQQVQVVDAYSGRAQTYALTTFLTSWATLGNMAVMGGKTDMATPTAPAPQERTYTIQSGDYLVALARRFDTTWQKLVELNNIPYPYTIFPGQVIRLPPTVQQPPLPTPTPVNHIVVPPTPSSPMPQIGETYLVQRGEYLVMIANRFGMDWRTLATLNGIGYPYVIYAGQVLHLR
jgi:uncharacterized protein YvpB/LysM repeat protein